MEETKIQLSTDEMLLMQDPAWILTKNRVMEKIAEGLGELAGRMQAVVAEAGLVLWPEAVFSSAKISKGEKYKGLPYLILDYPRHFQKEEILAIRTLFWWGNYCSVTLHVRGRFVPLVNRRLQAVDFVAWPDSYVSVSGDEWNHDVHTANYTTTARYLEQNLQPADYTPDFLKLTVSVPLGQWPVMETALFEAFKYLVKLLQY